MESISKDSKTKPLSFTKVVIIKMACEILSDPGEDSNDPDAWLDQGLEVGLLVQNRIDKLTCSLCQTTFQRTTFLEAHMASHTKSQEFKCDECDKIFHHEANLKAHKSYHKDAELKLKCQFCDEYVKGKRGLHNHVKRFHTMFTCEFCESKFTFTKLQSHMKKMHRAEQRDSEKVSCDMCELSFSSSRALMSHKRSHDPKLSVPSEQKMGPATKVNCEFCGQTMANTSCLKTHFRRVHLETECEECGKLVPNMTQHLRMAHSKFPSKSAPTVCPEPGCSKTFTNFYQAQRHHKRVHLRIHCPKMECPVCGKLVIRLSVHMDQVHGENCHECRICGKFFPVKSTLERHIQNVHHPVKADCPFCEVEVKLFHLPRHLTSVHNLDPKSAGELVEGISGKSAARTDLQWTAFSTYKEQDECEHE